MLSMPRLLARSALALVAVAFAVAVHAQSPLRLGAFEFPTSARSQEAQQHFLRGVAALHSFWYPVARDAFQQAANAEPGFAMAHWGEAMTHDHPVWGDPQATEAGRAALARIDDRADITPRERAYIDAVRLLYGEGDKRARDRAYAQAMQRLHERFPKDAEATLFYALALLGSGDVQARLRAGAIAHKVFEAHPNHPGAAHYTIHAYDDPKHARLALPAARRYADVAPDSAHALHMPSHVFLQLGMWPEAARSNERAWQASLSWVRDHAGNAHTLDIHSLHWLLYAYLQQGRYEQAASLVETMRETLSKYPQSDPQMLAFAAWTQAAMAATWLIETEQWQHAADVLRGPQEVQGPQAFVALAGSPATFARGMAAANTGAAQEARDAAEELRGLRTPPQAQNVPYIAAILSAARIQARMIDAAVAAHQKDFPRALEAARDAVASTERRPPPVGPPQLIKPPHELLADILLAAGEEEPAQQNYRTALARHENRARSLLGAARAAAANGDARRARQLYANLERQWKGADAALPPL